MVGSGGKTSLTGKNQFLHAPRKYGGETFDEPKERLQCIYKSTQNA
jgi:hypothetical protein